MNDATLTDHLLAVPAGTRNRLRTFYGSSATAWLNTVIASVNRAASAWGMDLVGCHDRGWTSLVAHGITRDSQPVILKAVPDPVRYRRELHTLQHWNGHAAAKVLNSDDLEQILLLAMVGHAPGGASRPDDDEIRTALRLPSLHEKPTSTHAHVPDLDRIFTQRLRPQLAQSALLKEHVGRAAIKAILQTADAALAADRRHVMLHGDLYAENVVYDACGHPTFIDPRGSAGPASYDWAFWCVFYLDEGFQRRLSLLNQLGVAEPTSVLPWIAVLAADRLRYHIQATDDQGADRMHAILASPPVRTTIGA